MIRTSSLLLALVLTAPVWSSGVEPQGCADKKCLQRWFKAVRSHDLRAVDSLLLCGANVDVQDRDGNTALMLASYAEWRDHRIAERLLKAGANVNATGRNGSTALRYTIGIGGAGQDTVLFQLLLEYGADVNASCAECCDRGAFLYTCMWGTPGMVEAMLAKGAYANSVDCEGRNALMHAVEGRNMAVVERLLRSGADTSTVDRRGGSVLEQAERLGDEAILQLLRMHGQPDR